MEWRNLLSLPLATKYETQALGQSLSRKSRFLDYEERPQSGCSSLLGMAECSKCLLPRPFSQLDLPTLRRQTKRKLDNQVFYWQPQYKFLRAPPGANPFVFHAEEHPSAGGRIRRIERYRLECPRADE